MLAKHVACGSGALLDRVLPVLNADVPAECRLIMIRDISSGVHAADVRLAILVNDNAVVHMNSATCEYVDCRFDTDANDDKVAVKALAAFGDDARHTLCSLKGSNGILEDRSNAVSAMELGEGFAYCLTQYAQERCLRRVDSNDFQASLAERRCDFRADETHADDDHSAARNHLGPDAIGILTGAKCVNAFEITAGNRNASIACARSDQQSIERHATLILELYDPRGRIDARDGCPEHGFDALLRIGGIWLNQGAIEGHFAPEVRFGKRWALIRRLMFSPDQDHGTVGALLAQRDRGRRASKAGAHDDIRLRHQTSTCSVSPSIRVRYTLTGRSAGGARTFPVRTSNSEP